MYSLAYNSFKMVLTIKNNNEAGTIYGGIFGKLANEKDPNSWMSQSKERIEQYNSFITSKSQSDKSQSDAQKYLETLKNIDKETYDIISKYDGKKVPLEGADKEIQKVSAGFDTARLKAIAFNAAVNIGVAILGTLVTIGVQKLLDNFKNAEEVAKSATSALERYKEAQDTIKSNAEEVNGLLDEYNELSKSVNSLGENVSLSSDEFERYHEIVNKVAQMFPGLVQGWDSEGNAIINNIKNLKEYIALQQRKEAQNLVNGTGDYEDEGSVEDIIKNANNEIKNSYKEQSYSTTETKQVLTNRGYTNQTVTVQHQIEVIDKFGLEDKTNALVKLLNSLTGDTNDAFKKFVAGFDDFNSELYGQEAAYKQLLEEIGLDVTQGWADISFDEYDFNYLKNNISTIQNSIGTFKTDLEQYKSDYVTAANSILIANTDYGNWLSAQEDTAEYASKQIIDTFIQNTDVSWFAGKTQDELKKTLQSIVEQVKSLTPAQKKQYEIMLAVNTKFNDGDISYDAWKTKIDAFLKLFGDDKEKVKTFKIAFDYKDVTNKYNQARNALRDDNNPTGVGGIFSIDGKTNGSVKVDDVLGLLNNDELEQVCNKEFQQKLTKWFKETSPKTAQEIANWIRDSVAKAKKEDFNSKDLFEKLSQSVEALKTLDTAFSELQKDGDVSYDTLSKIRTAFSNVDGIDNYVNKLAEAKGNTEATNKVLGELATKYVSAQFTANELANANQAVVASMLKEAGVANSNQVAMQMIAQAKMQAAIESGDFSNKTWNEINALLSESGATQAASQALAIYHTNKMLADKTTFDNTDSINKLLNEAKTAGITGSQYEKLLRIKELSEQFDKTKDTRGKSSIKSEIRQIQKSMSSDIEFTPVNFKPIKFTGSSNDKSGSSSSSSSSGSSSDKSYTATEDPWLKKRQAELDKVAHQHEMGKISEEKYLDKIQKIEKKFAPKIKKKTNEVNNLKTKYSKLSKDERKSKSGKKLKADLKQAKEDLKDIKKQDQDLQKEIHGLKLDDRKEEYENYQTKQINKYIDGKIDKKKLEKRLKNKLKSLFKNFDKDTYKEYLSSMGEDISEAMADRLNSEMDKLDNQRDFDLISESDYYKEKLKLAESYYNKSKEFADEYTDALVEMYDYAKDQYLDDLEEQKETLEDQKEVISDFYETQRELLQDQSDNDTYLKDQSEKRKNINDLKLQLTELEKDTSEKSKKRIAELQDELANAQDELTEFEKQHTLDQTIAMLEEMEEKHLAKIDNQIEKMDNKISSINDNTGNIYKAVIDFAKKQYGVDIDVSKIGLKAYASGTSSSVGGLVKTQENRLAELIGMNTGSGTFTMLTPSSKVWNSTATDFLYEFANNPTKSLLEKLGGTTSSITQNITTVNNSPTYNININEGAVIIQGNADEKVLNESNQKLTYNILNELKRLKSK